MYTQDKGAFTNYVDKYLAFFDCVPRVTFSALQTLTKVNIFGLPTHLVLVNVVYERP